MDKDSETPSDDMVGPSDLLVASLIIAMALLAFRIGYWAGRDIGPVLFN